MPDSNSTTHVTTRLANRVAEDLHLIADLTGTTRSALVAEAVISKLAQLRAAAA